MINTNLRSNFLYVTEAAKQMKQNSHGGLIVNFASTQIYMSKPNSEAYELRILKLKSHSTKKGQTIPLQIRHVVLTGKSC